MDRFSVEIVDSGRVTSYTEVIDSSGGRGERI